MKEIFAEYRPEIVFHLAAQPLVRLSYEIPVDTWQTNVMGTIHIMEAIRATDSVKAGVMITTDKCYENKEQLRGYKEDDPFGGHDPYSASKGACEIAIQSWRRSYGLCLASARAGNVIGGGDWAKDRIIPDCIRAIEAGRPVEIRSPRSVRPWQHVLEPLGGYLLLAQKMWEQPEAFCEGWNFGPEEDTVLTVRDVATRLMERFGAGELRDVSSPGALHEAGLLRLDITKAKTRLGWKPRLDASQTIALTADWYQRYRTEDVYRLCVGQINTFLGV
jgi:CDP-glucose 4,6-dehydratase